MSVRGAAFLVIGAMVGARILAPLGGIVTLRNASQTESLPLTPAV